MHPCNSAGWTAFFYIFIFIFKSVRFCCYSDFQRGSVPPPILVSSKLETRMGIVKIVYRPWPSNIAGKQSFCAARTFELTFLNIHQLPKKNWIGRRRLPSSARKYNSKPRTVSPIPVFRYDLDILGQMYSWSVWSVAHIAGWGPYSLHDLGHGSWVGSVLYRSCTTSHNGRLGYGWSRSWSIWSIWSVCPRCENLRKRQHIYTEHIQSVNTEQPNSHQSAIRNYSTILSPNRTSKNKPSTSAIEM